MLRMSARAGNFHTLHTCADTGLCQTKSLGTCVNAGFVTSDAPKGFLFKN